MSDFCNVIFIPEQATTYLVSTTFWRKCFTRYLPFIPGQLYPQTKELKQAHPALADEPALQLQRPVPVAALCSGLV